MKKTRRNTKYQGWIAITALIFFMATLGSQQAFAQTSKTILRLHGSNTIGAKLAPDLAEAFLKKIGADTVRRKEIIPSVEVNVEGVFNAQNIIQVIEIKAHGSSTGFKGLQEGKCDIAMASRRVKDKEVAALSSLGDMKSVASEHVLALDGVAIIVNTANILRSRMTSETLGKIFTGEINNWSQVGGKDAPIKVHARDENSGTHDTFKSLILGKKNKLVASAQRWESNEDLSDAVNTDINAIGYCGLPYVKFNKVLSVSDGGTAIKPTVFTVATEDYPVSRRLYLYTPALPDNPYTQQFIAFALGEEGQKYVRKNRFVDLTITAKQHKVEISGMNHNFQKLYKYLNTVRNARKLSASFRFQGESMKLDNRGLRDLNRLMNFLAENQAGETILVGFSDSKGPYEENYRKSCRRAEAVKEEFEAMGLPVRDVLCVGEELPIASNKTEVGREKNRRVEVWIK
ncbi:substrate-binding domain-containing protein [Candidatus Electrothrix sp.]|uniref:substrate-binding domain-containing protein n=1 Tax=Candidatus Electrothrix sp. TaxID=2170559 RepID=UPI0040560F4B